MKKNQLKGRLELVLGNTNDVVGKIWEDESMEMVEKVRKNDGKVRARYADLKDDIKNAR
ncbi:CsbD family protein [Methylomonas rhizoryzae]|uniref:CsbD family protein n=1 Tax=Methylomonas rhizoryzae TaxID=2608981 RepID=UPI001231DD10|nr:CsbD family protein [Methylomonas rhizoryzae]